MIRLFINSQKHGQVYKDFETQLEVDAEIFDHNVVNPEAEFHWGKLAYTEVIPAKPAILDEQGVEIVPAIAEQIINHPATVVFTQTDITLEIQKEQDDEDSKEFLENTDLKVLRYLAKKVLGKSTATEDADFVALEAERELKRSKLK